MACIFNFTFAAIAQSVERILGKDEVASSNLASSSKESRKEQAFEVLFLLRKKFFRSSLFYSGTPL